MIKAVIFDYDDTLVETRRIKYEHHKTVAKKFYDIDLEEETFLKHYGKPFDTLIKELYKNSDTLENMVAANVSIGDKFLKKVYTNSLNTITALLDHGMKIGILSATRKSFILDDLARGNFPIDRFTIIQGPGDTEVHKPNPDVFIPVLDKLKKEGIKKREIVYVGDSLMDLEAATKAGLNFIAVTTGLYSREDFEKSGTKIIVKDISELVEIIKRM